MNLKTLGWPERGCIKIEKMATQQEDFVAGEDLDAVFSLIEKDFFEDDVNFIAKVKEVIDEIPSVEKNKSSL